MNECIEIKERFGLDRFSIDKISKFYLYNITIRVGTVQDTLKYLVDTLKALGKDEDDIRYYLIKMVQFIQQMLLTLKQDFPY